MNYQENSPLGFKKRRKTVNNISVKTPPSALVSARTITSAAAILKFVSFLILPHLPISSQRFSTLAPGTFANHCLPYSVLYVIGNSCFGWNCLAPWLSYPSQTAIRWRFNLEWAKELA
ncbi:hypothetical protein V8G54_026011 [Vigna mungo]|uniref:Uncharacterized protein n=1 Tax=Vigna mungo TaxID=3915 RepID=A0AAQ3RMT3_VIGMU